jgi:hypothetical protein
MLNTVTVLGEVVMFEASIDTGMRTIAAPGKHALIVPGNLDGVDWMNAILRNLPRRTRSDGGRGSSRFKAKDGRGRNIVVENQFLGDVAGYGRVMVTIDRTLSC